MAVDAGKVALNPRGAYSSTTTYERLDVVTYQSNTYVALQTTLGNLPTDTSSWMALVKVDNASMSVRGLVKVDGTSITADADGTIHGHAAAGVNTFNGRDGDVLPEYGDYDAEQIAYDNSNSGLTSNRAQGAIDEITTKTVTFALSVGASTSKTVSGINANMRAVSMYIADPSKVTSSTVTVTTSDYDGVNPNVVVSAAVTAATNITLTFAPSTALSAT